MRPAELTLVVLVLTTIAVIGAKAITRSGTPLRGGFPSGHAALAFAGWMAITLLVDEQQFLVSSVAFVLAAARGADARRVGHPLAARGLLGRDPRLADRPRRDPGLRVVNDVLTEMKAYYAARAPEYDDWWFRRGRYDLGEEGNARWAAEAAEVEAALDALRPFGSVVELAAGTGLWTRHLVEGATRVLALDANAETLAINRERTGGRAEYRVADLFAWEPDERFDLCVFGFWLSHVPEARFERFWDTVRRASGRFFLVDSAAGDPAHLWESAGEREVRRLSDGREFEIVKRRWSPDGLAARLGPLGWEVDLRTSSGGSFVYGSGRIPV